MRRYGVALAGGACLLALLACGANKDLNTGRQLLDKNEVELASLRFVKLTTDKPGFLEARYYAAFSLLLNGDYAGAQHQQDQLQRLADRKKKASYKYDVTPEKIRALGLVLAAKNNQTALYKNKQLDLVEVLEAFARDPRDILATGAADILGQWRFAWKFETMKRVRSQPLVVDQSIYLGSDDGNLYCVNANDGVFLWSADLGHPFYNNAPFLADGKMYAIGADTMREVDVTQKGKVVGRFPNITTQPCFANGLLYATFSPSILKPEDQPSYEVRCQELASKRVRWKMSVPNEFCFATPVLANNLVYVQASNKFFALEEASGKPRWTFDIYSRNYPRVTLLVDNSLIFGSDLFLYRLNAADGALLWKTKVGGEFESSPAYANGVCFIGNNDSHLYAFTADGKIKWKYRTIGRIVSAPQVGAAGVYFGSEDGNIYALDAATGAIKWKYHTEKGCVSSPAVANGMVFIGSNDNNLYAFSEELK